MDEYDYKTTIENQEKVPYDKHWRKHSMSNVDSNFKVTPPTVVAMTCGGSALLNLSIFRKLIEGV